MPEIGQTVSHYRIVEKIGQGGMGEVYLGDDTTLDRKVALKFLPKAFTMDPERMARFEREAKLLASLNHTNIAGIYGLEQDEGNRFLVLEYVAGETLQARLSKGALQLEDALAICRQITEGLEAAHDKGVIHRDLKPGNVMITAEEKVKILDFGLAKALVDETQTIDPADSPTITEAMTQPGVILGTAAYMSPEQATGKSVDKRADIWAFGCILFECLTDKRTFDGETVTETLAAILKGEPDWNQLPTRTPALLRTVLHRCLQKDPKLRLHDIADVRIEIEESATHASEAAAVPRRFSLLWVAACAAIVLFVGIFIGLTLVRYFQPAPSKPLVTTAIKINPGYWLAGMQWGDMERPSRTAMAISSDGKFIVYCAIEENPDPQAKSRLYLRRMNQSEAKPITGTEGGTNPFLSPDDRWVGFWVDAKLEKVSVEGGVATALCDASVLYGANWGRNNSIVFSDGEKISRISAEGGTPEILTEPDPKREESSHRLPSWLPNGKAVVFTVMRHPWDTQPWIALLRLDTQKWDILLQDAADARYISTGHLVFLRQGTLMAVRFDLARLEVIGQPVALVDNVMQIFTSDSYTHTGAGQFCVSETGSLIYAAGGIPPDMKNSLVWVDQSGIEQPVTDLQLPFFAPRLSPDGRRIAYQTLGHECQIWVYDINNGTNSRLTSDGRPVYPIWSPDGKRLLYAWQKSVVTNLFWQAFDGSSAMERITTSECYQYPGSWSSDGKTLALVEIHRDTGADIALLEIHTGSTKPFLNSRFNERNPEFSPDGKWIAYASDDTGRQEVYVRPYPEPGMKYQVSNDGGYSPLWARNGKQLFYRWWDQVWVADVQTDGGFATSKPRLLFEKSGYGSGAPIRSWDLSNDGQRFLMYKIEQRKPTPVTEIILMQNWFEELKQRVPVD